MPDIETMVADAMISLTAIAKVGRPAWEALAQAIAESEQADEIQSFMGEIAEGEI